MLLWILILLPAVASVDYCNLCEVDQDRPLKSLVGNTIVIQAAIKMSEISYKDSISTKNKTLRLQMQEDGNLVLFDLKKEKPIWATMPKETFIHRANAKLQSDGVLAVFANIDNNAIYVSQSAGKGTAPYCVVVSDNPSRYGVSIYDSQCEKVWHPSVAQL
ncbi:hypothetical protein AC1031_002352 [Aphanomyces cochlioides]|nr:hypothetical protein AC1031_002352 [Aphanomyces cochlioides]